MNGAGMHSIPQEPGQSRAIALALLVHLALLAFLWIGVHWQNEAPAAAEAEVWDMQAREAAPKPVAPPEPVVETKPVVTPTKPVITPPSAPKAVQRELAAKPDIALEREKKRKELAQKKADEAKRIHDARLAKEEDAKRIRQEKTVTAKKKRAQELADQRASEAIRVEEMRRIAGNTGSGGSGAAARSTGNNRADAGYVQKVSAKIKSNTAFSVPPSLSGNPFVEYSVELLPDGTLRRSPRKEKSSGVPGFDEAVLRAIEKSSPFPPDRSGSVPPGFIVSHKPKG